MLTRSAPRPTRRRPEPRARRARRSVLALVAVAVGSLLGAEAVPVAAHPSPGSARGIDVSSFQHPGGAPIDWNRVRASGVSFAYIKATEGPVNGRPTYTNSWFQRDWQAARAAGLQRGAYHYARPRLPITTAGYDADRFLYVAGVSYGPSDLPPVLDLEETGGLSPANLLAWANAWIAEVVRATGVRPIVYSAWWFLDYAVSQSSTLAKSALWIADYSGGSQPSRVPASWPRWSIWQYTGSGTVPGVAVPVDKNVACSLSSYGTPNARLGSCQGVRPPAPVTSKTSSTSKSTSSKGSSGSTSTSTTRSSTSTKTTSTTKSTTSSSTKSSGTSSTTKYTTPTTTKYTTRR